MYGNEAQWYYTSGTERFGPVDRATLVGRARSGHIDPRADLVWGTGMSEWRPAGEIEGLFERRAAPPALAPGAPVAPAIAAAGVPAPAPAALTTYDERPLSMAQPQGIGRLAYFLGMLLLPGLVGTGAAFAINLLGQVLDPQLAAFSSLLILIVPVVVIMIVVKRLQNLGMSGWWWLGNFIPFVNLWVGYRCFACPPGYATVRRMDGIGIFLAILYWLWLLIVAAGCAMILMFVWQEIQKGDWNEAMKKLRENYEVMEMKRPASPHLPH